MAKKKGNRILFLRECTVCKNRNYITEKNKVNTPAKFEGVKKLCKTCGKHTLHKEVQKLK
ncbi:50S ribosomal protein L33 [Patescibacteria group bacterium]|nr:50S ribosomal protein L33 [Patescibacteria group bacterium]